MQYNLLSWKKGGGDVMFVFILPLSLFQLVAVSLVQEQYLNATGALFGLSLMPTKQGSAKTGWRGETPARRADRISQSVSILTTTLTNESCV